MPSVSTIKTEIAKLAKCDIHDIFDYIREIGVKTSFFMRHKILDAVRAYMGIGEV